LILLKYNLHKKYNFEQKIFIMKNETPIFLKLEWNPKENISINELAFCLPYILKNTYLTDFSLFKENQNYFRHFDIIEHYKPILVSENYSIDPRVEDDFVFDEGTLYEWNPLDDITVFEMAQAIPLISCGCRDTFEPSDIDRHFKIKHLPLKTVRLNLTPRYQYGFREPHTFFHFNPKKDITLDEFIACLSFDTGHRPTREVDFANPLLRHYDTSGYPASSYAK
jgi:hypothetical protein